MGKNNKKSSYTVKEEKQGKKVIMWIGIAAIALAVLMMIAMAYV